MAKPELKVVVLGDSAMWGQGLLERTNSPTKSAQEIGKLLGREAQIVINSARSGAVIRAGRTPKEAERTDERLLIHFRTFLPRIERSKASFINGVKGLTARMSP